MKTRNIRAWLAIGAACLMAWSSIGCGEEVEPLGNGSLALTWEVSPRVCELADVEHIEVELTNDQNQYKEVYECEEAEALLKDIWPGHYELMLTGVSQSGMPTFVSKAETVVILADSVAPLSKFVRLSARKASLDVEWMFENGRVCGANKIEVVEVTVYDDADYEIAHKSFPCNRGMGYFEGFTAGDLYVEVVAVSASGMRNFRGYASTTLKRGDSGYVKVMLGP